MEFNYIDLLIVLLRGLCSLVILFFITKLLGKKQVSELSLFDYVIGISIGNFAAEVTINLDSNLWYALFAVVEFGLIAFGISIATMKSIVIRRFFIGVPTVLIDKGKILSEGLKKVHFDINDLQEQCRSNGYFDISEIEYAIMEVNGTLSIMPKYKYKPVTINDLSLKELEQGLCANVIIDGKIMKKNLKGMNKTENWLLKELKIKGKEVEEILLATLDYNEKLTIYIKNDGEKPKNILE